MPSPGVAPVFTEETKDVRKRITIVVCTLLVVHTLTLILGIFGEMNMAVTYGMVVELLYNLLEVMVFFGCEYFDFSMICICRIFLFAYDLAWFITLCVRPYTVYEILCSVLLAFAMVLNAALIHLYKTLPRYYPLCCCCPPTAQNPFQTVQYITPNQLGQIIQLPNGQQVIYQQETAVQPVEQPTRLQELPNVHTETQQNDLPPSYDEVVNSTGF